MYNIIYHMEI